MRADGLGRHLARVAGTRASRGVIVVADSTIQYRKAVTGEFVCRCSPDAAALAAGLEQLEQKGRASFDLVCTIDSDEKRAVTFTGNYVVHAKHA